MTVKRMDNILIVVDDLELVKAFFIELGLVLEGQTTVEGPAIGKLIGLGDVRATLAMLRTPDGQGVELTSFIRPMQFDLGRRMHQSTLWVSVGSCLPSMTSALSLNDYRPVAQKS